jgi:hypothetical protein
MSRELKVNPNTAHKAVMHVVSKGRLREVGLPTRPGWLGRFRRGVPHAAA